MQPASHGADRDVKYLCHFFVFETFKVTKDNHCSKINIERIQRVRDLVTNHVLESFHSQVWRDLPVYIFRVIISLYVLIIDFIRLLTSLPIVVNETVFQNAEQPCFRISSFLE